MGTIVGVYGWMLHSGFVVFETRSHYVALAGLELTEIYLLLSPEFGVNCTQHRHLFSWFYFLRFIYLLFMNV